MMAVEVGFDAEFFPVVEFLHNGIVSGFGHAAERVAGEIDARLIGGRDGSGVEGGERAACWDVKEVAAMSEWIGGVEGTREVLAGKE